LSGGKLDSPHWVVTSETVHPDEKHHKDDEENHMKKDHID
jgi:hypothetical protein